MTLLTYALLFMTVAAIFGLTIFTLLVQGLSVPALMRWVGLLDNRPAPPAKGH